MSSNRWRADQPRPEYLACGDGQPASASASRYRHVLRVRRLSVERRQLVRFVEDDQVVGFHLGVAECAEDAFARQRVDRDDRQVARSSLERTAGLTACAGPGRRRHVRPAQDPERQAKERPQLSLPVADQPCRGRDQHATDAPAREHVAHDQSGHDRLPRPRVVGKKKAERVLRQHVLVDRDPLVRQRVDPRDLAGKRRVELVSVLQPQRFGHGRDGVGVPVEVEGLSGAGAVRATKWRIAGPRGVGRSGSGLRRGDLLFQLAEPIQGQPPGLGVAGLPAVDGQRRDQQPCRKLLLGQPRSASQALDAGGRVALERGRRSSGGGAGKMNGAHIK